MCGHSKKVDRLNYDNRLNNSTTMYIQKAYCEGSQQANPVLPCQSNTVFLIKIMAKINPNPKHTLTLDPKEHGGGICIFIEMFTQIKFN